MHAHDYNNYKCTCVIIPVAFSIVTDDRVRCALASALFWKEMFIFEIFCAKE